MEPLLDLEDVSEPTAVKQNVKNFVLSRDWPICIAIGCCIAAGFVLSFKVDSVKTAITTIAIWIIAVNCCLEFYKEPSKPYWKTVLGIIQAIIIIFTMKNIAI